MSKLYFLLGYEIRDTQYQFLDIKLKKYISSQGPIKCPWVLGTFYAHDPWAQKKTHGSRVWAWAPLLVGSGHGHSKKFSCTPLFLMTG